MVILAVLQPPALEHRVRLRQCIGWLPVNIDRFVLLVVGGLIRAGGERLGVEGISVAGRGRTQVTVEL